MATRRRTNKVDINALVDLYERCAGIDVHKETVTVCVIAAGDRRFGAGRNGHLRNHHPGIASTEPMAAGMRRDPRGDGIHRRLLAAGVADSGGGRFSSILANAKQVRNMPGRKTDQADAVWLATLLRKGLIKGSFIAPPQIRALRDLCRSRASLVQDRTRVVQRIEKVLEEANIKLDTVASDLMGVGPRMMLEELIRAKPTPPRSPSWR